MSNRLYGRCKFSDSHNLFGKGVLVALKGAERDYLPGFEFDFGRFPNLTFPASYRFGFSLGGVPRFHKVGTAASTRQKALQKNMFFGKPLVNNGLAYEQNGQSPAELLSRPMPIEWTPRFRASSNFGHPAIFKTSCPVDEYTPEDSLKMKNFFRALASSLSDLDENRRDVQGNAKNLEGLWNFIQYHNRLNPKIAQKS